MSTLEIDSEKRTLLRKGTVIPAHPLALAEGNQIDEPYQRALTRYYLSAGSGGIAVGVHTTQFEIRDSGIDLFEPVLKMAAEEVDAWAPERPILKVAGICGPTDQAIAEAETAARLGYDLGLLSPGGLGDWSEEQLLKRAREVARVVPIFGFYLQPAVGGRVLSYRFWREFADIPNVLAIKVAAFNRYQTLDVVRAVIESDRRDDIALYTGNDDNIINDLLTPFRIPVNGSPVTKRFVGGLLGHWAVWTSKAVEMLNEIHQLGENYPASMLTLNAEVTDSNAVVFDAANQFHGCIPGIHEVLYRQGLLRSIRCLNPEETLSSGQSDEIDRIYRDYPHLTDDTFVKINLDRFFD
ncbi:MAG: dihydrodipicolinate synthase family protein [Bacteroidota bacterium]